MTGIKTTLSHPPISAENAESSSAANGGDEEERKRHEITVSGETKKRKKGGGGERKGEKVGSEKGRDGERGENRG